MSTAFRRRQARGRRHLAHNLGLDTDTVELTVRTSSLSHFILENSIFSVNSLRAAYVRVEP
eukprot:7817125-Pyramimonas_sp.AAC.1